MTAEQPETTEFKSPRRARRAKRRKLRKTALPTQEIRSPAGRPPRRNPELLSERVLRSFVVAQDIPHICENRACRRSGRCCGIWPLTERGKTLPCFDSRRELLEPRLLELFESMKVYWYGIGNYQNEYSRTEEEI